MKPDIEVADEHLDWQESDLFANRRGGLSSRMLIRVGLLVTTVVVLAATFTLWFPAGQRWWQDIFPYRGPVVVVNIAGGALYGLNPTTGATLWQTPAGKSYEFQGFTDAQNAYAIEGALKVVALDKATGKARWQYALPANHSLHIMEAGDGRLCVIERSFQVEDTAFVIDCFEGNSGKRLFQTTLNRGGDLIDPTVTVGAQTIYVGGAKQGSNIGGLIHFYAIDRQTGKIRWDVSSPNTLSLYPSQEQGGVVFAHIQTSPEQNGSLRSFSVVDGTFAWGPDAILSDVIVDQQRWYAITQMNNGFQSLVAYQQEMNAPLWEMLSIHRSAYFSAPLLADGKRKILILTWFDNSNTSGTTGIDSETGKTLWDIRALGDIFSFPTIVKNQIYFQTLSGVARYALDGTELWNIQTTFAMNGYIASTTDTTLYMVSDNHLGAIDTATGKLRWEKSFRSGVATMAVA